MAGHAPPTLYIDLASPYAYLAFERAPAVLGVAPRLEPIVLGAIFALRGHGSWAHGPERDANVAEVERRARVYGLPAIAWPAVWPPNSLHANRAVLWAERHGGHSELARLLFRLAFAEGRDLTDHGVLRAAAAEVGLPATDLEEAIADPALKQELKDRTAAAWDAGVRGVPTLRIGGDLFYGDDRLEAGGQALGAARR